MRLSLPIACIACCANAVPALQRSASSAPIEPAPSAQFNWNSLHPDASLQYQPCYNGFECARMLLPLDYRNVSNQHKVSIAIIRLPAVVPEHDPNHGGSIILNPGGPGGSGVQFALAAAEILQKRLSANGGKSFEIVSFDPRGILHSTPNLYCFATPFDAELWRHEKLAKGPLDQSQASLGWQWHFELARARVCEQSEVGKWPDGTNLRQYVSTAFVARDMLELVKAIDLRKQTIMKASSRFQQAAFQASSPAQPKLQFYGQSYGTFLGQLFASMYPDHVSRMVLDGNIDGDNWVSAHEYSVDDGETIRAYFFEACFAAGRSCPFWGPGDSVAADQEARYAGIVARLAQKPAFVTCDGHATLLTPESLENAFFSASYQPADDFARLAKLLLDVYLHLEHDEPLDHVDLFWELPSPSGDRIAPEELAHVLQNDEIAAFVHCADGPDLTDHNLSSFKWHLDDLKVRFPHVAAEQANYKLPCWTTSAAHRTKWRYEGPFGSDDTPPLLFLNNRLDVATPAKSARKMAGRFAGSKLVISGNFGHVALWNGGDCVWHHVWRYMNKVTLPKSEEGWCDRTHVPFPDVLLEEGVLS